MSLCEGTLGTISDNKSRSSDDNASDPFALVLGRDSVFVRENLLKNRDTAEGPGLDGCDEGFDEASIVWDEADDSLTEGTVMGIPESEITGDFSRAPGLTAPIAPAPIPVCTSTLGRVLREARGAGEALRSLCADCMLDLFNTCGCASFGEGEGTTDALLLQNEKIPLDFLSATTGLLASSFTSGSTTRQPAGTSSTGLSTRVFTDSSQADELLLAKR